MRLALLASLLAGLAGLSCCGQRRAAAELRPTSPPLPHVVHVPVAVPCPAPSLAGRPRLPIADLQPGAGPDVVVRAYVASLEALAGYARELEELMGAYRSEPARPAAEQERKP